MRALLEKQLSELKTVRQAPALWRAETREFLFTQISASKQSTVTLSWQENFRIRFNQIQIHLAPLTLKPVLASLAVLLVIGTPIARATYQSLPGSALYTLKRSVERFQTALSITPEQEGLAYLAQAQKRLNDLSRVGVTTNLETTNSRNIEISKYRNIQDVQTRLLRDYNTSLSLAQAVFKSESLSATTINKYNITTYALLNNLRQMKLAPKVQSLYATSLGLSERVAQESVVLLVQAHTLGNNGLSESELAQRLTNQITNLENKLTVVQGKVLSLPKNKPSPRVVIESKQTIVPVREAPKVAIAAFIQAKELVEKKEFTQALAKVVEGDEITQKTEAAVIKSDKDDKDKKDAEAAIETAKSENDKENNLEIPSDISKSRNDKDGVNPPAGEVKGETDVKPAPDTATVPIDPIKVNP